MYLTRKKQKHEVQNVRIISAAQGMKKSLYHALKRSASNRLALTELKITKLRTSKTQVYIYYIILNKYINIGYVMTISQSIINVVLLYFT